MTTQYLVAMPLELVLPLLTFMSVRGKSKKAPCICSFLSFASESVMSPLSPLLELLSGDCPVAELSDDFVKISLVPDSGWRGELLRDGIRVALVGPPNAGKSTLLNKLAGR